jgi:hypothetical protein
MTEYEEEEREDWKYGTKAQSELWRARLELGEITTLDSSFTTEEQFQILHTRAIDAERRIDRLENIAAISFRLFIVWLLVGIAAFFY